MKLWTYHEKAWSYLDTLLFYSIYVELLFHEFIIFGHNFGQISILLIFLSYFGHFSPVKSETNKIAFGMLKECKSGLGCKFPLKSKCESLNFGFRANLTKSKPYWKTVKPNKKLRKTMKLYCEKPWKTTKNHEQPWDYLEWPWNYLENQNYLADFFG